MKFREIEGSGPQINLIPILDSIFILIFLFMMSLMQRVQRSEIKLNLPSSSSAISELENQKNKLNLILNADGLIFLEKQELSRKQLERELNIIRIEQPNQHISIHGDKTVNLGFLIEVLDLVKKNGFRNVTIETNLKTQDL